jgi:hypothetical protein
MKQLKFEKRYRSILIGKVGRIILKLIIQRWDVECMLDLAELRYVLEAGYVMPELGFGF